MIDQSADHSSVADPDDIVDINGVRIGGSNDQSRQLDSASPRRFLMVWFRCCHTYGRMSRNRAQTAYEGRCPRCGATVRATIGENGTSHRTFLAE